MDEEIPIGSCVQLLVNLYVEGTQEILVSAGRLGFIEEAVQVGEEVNLDVIFDDVHFSLLLSQVQIISRGPLANVLDHFRD